MVTQWMVITLIVTSTVFFFLISRDDQQENKITTCTARQTHKSTFSAMKHLEGKDVCKRHHKTDNRRNQCSKGNFPQSRLLSIACIVWFSQFQQGANKEYSHIEIDGLKRIVSVVYVHTLARTASYKVISLWKCISKGEGLWMLTMVYVVLL